MVTFVQRLALAMLALLAVAAPAGAAEVARVEGGVLDAREHRQAGFCLRLTQARSAFGGGGTSTCGRAPWRPRRSTLLTWPAGRERVLAAGAVPASVVRAEAELVDGRRIGFDTVAGPRYRGRYAGKLRFFLALLPLADPGDDETGGLVAVRLFAADGTLAGVAASDRDGTRIGRRRVLCASARASARRPRPPRSCASSRRRRSRWTASRSTSASPSARDRAPVAAARRASATSPARAGRSCSCSRRAGAAGCAP